MARQADVMSTLKQAGWEGWSKLLNLEQCWAILRASWVGHRCCFFPGGARGLRWMGSPPALHWFRITQFAMKLRPGQI
jgi:hypothetical protein